MVSLEVFINIILPAALWLWGDSASNRNEYQEYVLGGKGGRCVGLTTLPPSCADCLEIWESEPPGILRACPGQYRDCFTFLCSHHQEKLLYHCDTWYLSLCVDDRPAYQTVIHTHRVTYTRCRIYTVISPDDGHMVARNM